MSSTECTASPAGIGFAVDDRILSGTHSLAAQHAADAFLGTFR